MDVISNSCTVEIKLTDKGYFNDNDDDDNDDDAKTVASILTCTMRIKVSRWDWQG